MQPFQPEQNNARATGSVTLAHVAKLAGVSPITVSRALNQPDKVAPKNRVVGVVSLSTDAPHTLSEDAYGNRYWLAPNRDGKRGGLRKLTREEAATIEGLVRSKQEAAALAASVVLQPEDGAVVERARMGVLGLWKKALRSMNRRRKRA